MNANTTFTELLESKRSADCALTGDDIYDIEAYWADVKGQCQGTEQVEDFIREQKQKHKDEYLLGARDVEDILYDWKELLAGGQ